MATRKYKEFAEYGYGSGSVLRLGDQFRVKGGPIYKSQQGEIIPMYERGVFVFRCYWERGASKWIEAYRAGKGGVVNLWVGRTMPSPVVDGLRRRPYRITRKVSPSQATRQPRGNKRDRLRKMQQARGETDNST